MVFRKQAFILEVIRVLQLNKSAVGRNNIQKALFFINETASFKSPFDFVLHRQSPHSFDLDSEIDEMKTNSTLISRPSPGYGDELLAGVNAPVVVGRSPLLPTEKQSVAAVGEFVGRKTVEELEKIAAVVWVRSRERLWDRMQVANRVNALKPHISIVEALAADGIVASRLKLTNK
jgi:hypothetical protein